MLLLVGHARLLGPPRQPVPMAVLVYRSLPVAVKSVGTLAVHVGRVP